MINLEELLDKARNPDEMLKLAQKKAGGALTGASKKIAEDYGPVIGGSVD
jgi:hypothetical protein